MSTRESRPDALVIGAPKAGTSALHAALARHPEVYASAVKEPKYYLCGDAPPPAYCGPGDAHSQQEWVWRRADYLSLFDPAPAETVRLESTPFYLYLPDARRRIAEDLPDVRLVAIIRDPVDRAYSNWMHLWVDGLEPEADFCAAWRAEEARIDAGWAPVLALPADGPVRRAAGRPVHPGRPGSGAGAPLPRAGVRARPDPGPGLDLPRDRDGPGRGGAPGQLAALRRAGPEGRRARSGGAGRCLAGSYVRPEIWREAVKPFYRALQYGGPERRPKLAPEVRAELVKDCLDDIGLLEEVLKESFDDWRSSAGRGSFKERTAS